MSLCDTPRHPQRGAGTHLVALEHLGDMVEDLGGGWVVAGRGIMELPEVHPAHIRIALSSASCVSRVSGLHVPPIGLRTQRAVPLGPHHHAYHDGALATQAIVCDAQAAALLFNIKKW